MLTKDVTMHIQDMPATIKGHLHRTRKNLRSTTKTITASNTLQQNDMHPIPDPTAPCELFYFATLADTHINTLYTDLTGKFPVQSYSRNKYIFFAYIYSANAIIVRPMKDRTYANMLDTFKDIYKYLTILNLKPSLHLMYNKYSAIIHQFI